MVHGTSRDTRETAEPKGLFVPDELLRRARNLIAALEAGTRQSTRGADLFTQACSSAETAGTSLGHSLGSKGGVLREHGAFR